MRYQLFQHNNMNGYFTLVDREGEMQGGKYYILIPSEIKEICRDLDDDNRWYYATRDELTNHHLFFEFDTLEELQNKFMEYLI